MLAQKIFMCLIIKKLINFEAFKILVTARVYDKSESIVEKYLLYDVILSYR